MNLFQFQFAGLAFLIAGFLFTLKLDEDVFKFNKSTSYMVVVPIFLIVIGILILAEAILGCIGMIKMNKCMITTVRPNE